MDQDKGEMHHKNKGIMDTKKGAPFPLTIIMHTLERIMGKVDMRDTNITIRENGTIDLIDNNTIITTMNKETINLS